MTERPRWFAGQLVGPADLESLQQWVIGRARRHNRMMHGWGVSCGLAVTATTSPVTGELEPWSVTVGPGYALSACGDEVCVPTAVRIDMRQPRPDGDDVCAPPVDPWCAPVRVRRDPERVYYLAIRYAEEHRRPVRSTACGCGCDDDPCEFSRIAETYTLAVLDELPDCYQDEAVRQPDRMDLRAFGDAQWSAAQAVSSAQSMQEAVRCSPRMRELGTRPCPDCCSPWVVLADLRVDTKGTVSVEPLAHRRFVASFGSYGFTCATTDYEEKTRVLTDADREVMKASFTTSSAPLTETGEPEVILAAPASTLRGAGRSKAIRDLIGDRSVAELAKADVSVLAAAAKGRGIEPAEVEHLHALANVVSRVLRT